jgi:hypothetical protein
MGGHSELDLKIEEEHKRERERETIMKQVSRLFTQRAACGVCERGANCSSLAWPRGLQVSDPRQRARLHKLFAIERQQAKQAILRLQG